ncbi:MAG: signal recognition particle-docking protein FtsY [Thermostichales cyanobacterium SZTDM-1c_bins_54]
MVFDWFRRRPQKDPDSDPQPAPSPAPTPAPTPAPIDYLAYAKAAYAAIQSQQASPPPPTPAAPPLPEPETEIPSQPVAFFELAPKAAARLEALEATAVAEPAPPPAEAVEVTEKAAEIAFDAGFRWSAEILAAQGRKAEEVTLEEITWLQKLQQGLGKTRRTLVNQLKALVGRGPIDAEAVEEIETVLLQADVGVTATDQIIQSLQQHIRQNALPPEQAVAFLKDLMRQMLSIGDPSFAPQRGRLNIWLIVGVNGAGKTTTIGKIANLAQASGYQVLIAAADTFRAAAVEQLKIWGQRSGVDVIANPGQNTDPAAVVFDAITAAQARGTELLLIDTAGRLQNKKNLMEELHKIRRIISKKAPDTPVESLLVLDATLGQNGLRQAEVFAEAAELTGVVLTKLDSTAKGGVAFAVVQQLKLPIRFIGAGEGIQDLRPFSSYEFVEALLADYN